MNATKEQIISLLSQGISTSQVAAACGVSDSYVSQLKAAPELSAQIAASSTAAVIADQQFDTTLERAEFLALEKIEKNLPFANMGQAMAAFRVLNGARRRADAFTAVQDQSTTITVNLTLPASSAAKYVVNHSNEIVEVEGQTMITATAKSLDTLLAARASATLQAPVATAMSRAAGILVGLAPVPRQAPRRLPLALSVDIL